MMAEEILLTSDGLKELQDELEHLKTVGRKEMSEKIKVALSFGDLSENAEYDEAKSEQGKLESRINELEAILQNYKLIDEAELPSDIVNRASKVTIRDMETKENITYQIVGPQQANPMKGRISDESPVGKALLGKKKGATVSVETPAGVLKYKIVDIELKK
ncbi:MAG: transcription elongation factor GreA [Clostridia bacterium]|nr:transcription elongation factor GreA [Clostridia bacterium]MBQ1895938.1 transcription elongation factor GreA [Clostridia bacterium]MBQ2091913.1 transcription elongation factor GreA [Clostridia bacterium]MBQ6753450.1 transcription elongation factor GreA [Clostridia bacterium]